MLDLLTTLQGSGLASFVLTSALGFPLLLCIHAIGMGFLVGMLVLIDLRILGFAPNLALPELGKYFRVIWIALALNFLSGALMFVGYAVDDFYNTSFRIKLLLVVIGLIIARVVQRRLFDPRRPQSQASGSMKALAAVSVVCWLGAISAGRLIAYIR